MKKRNNKKKKKKTKQEATVQKRNFSTRSTDSEHELNFPSSSPAVSVNCFQLWETVNNVHSWHFPSIQFSLLLVKTWTSFRLLGFSFMSYIFKMKPLYLQFWLGDRFTSTITPNLSLIKKKYCSDVWHVCISSQLTNSSVVGGRERVSVSWKCVVWPYKWNKYSRHKLTHSLLSYKHKVLRTMFKAFVETMRNLKNIYSIPVYTEMLQK